MYAILYPILIFLFAAPQMNAPECCDFYFEKEVKTESPYLHSNIISEVLPGDNGDMFVADSWLNKIVVFDSTGSFVRQIGQQGRGPGDFESVRALRIDGDSLYTLDTNLQRVTSFATTSGKVNETYLLPRMDNLRGRSGIFVDSEHLLINHSLPFRAGELQSERLGSFGVVNFRESDTIDRVFERVYHEAMILTFPEGGFAATSKPYGKFYVTRTDSEGNFYWGYPDSFSIEKWDGDRLVKMFKRDYQPVEITIQDIEDYYFPQLGVETLDELRERIRSGNADEDFLRIAERYVWVTTEEGEMPDYFPVYDWFTVCDNGYIWVALNTEDREQYKVLKLDSNGNEAGTGFLSKRVRFYTIKDGLAYGTEEDPETLEKNIVRYSISDTSIDQ